ncbi:MAG: hypothetical protein Q4A56_04840 [Porphyromonadaceae bacterium]|nr:hypothetical protein [Porphyromonadaceae bacterium]
MKKSIMLFAMACLLIACGQNEEKKAGIIYQNALTFYNEKSFDNAKNLLDSLHAKYPRQVEYRKKADTLFWQITIDEINRDMPIIDSALQTLLKDAESIAKNYKFTKDEKYQEVGDYEHKNMQNAGNSNRTYLKPITDERGRFRIISNLVGKSIKHKQIVAKVGDANASSVVANDEKYNSYNDFGVNYELVNYSEDEVKSLIDFFRQRADSQIEIVLKGEKDYSYKISKNNVKIILETYDFAQILKEVYKNQAHKSEMSKVYNILTLRLSKTEPSKAN